MSERIPEPKEAKAYLARKKIIETESWDELKWGEHAHAFTVAHSRGAAVLDDIYSLLNEAIANGESYQTFRKGLRKLMEAKGWYGRADKGPKDEAYINWRTRLIFHVNQRTAYEAGHYRRQLRGAALRPIWQYKSKLVGANRRQDHVAIHNKAFRFDDPFWDTYRPPNGWYCECYVVSLSEAGAERAGVELLASGPDGSPPALADSSGNPIDWKTFTSPEWCYNPGREAIAPNFGRYENLATHRLADGRSALTHVIERYRADMDKTRMSEGEFEAVIERMGKKDYTPANILYQVGNLAPKPHEAMQKAGVEDSKIMTLDKTLYSATADSTSLKKLSARHFLDLYQTMQSPQRIYENTRPEREHEGREFHFVKDTGEGQLLMVVLKQVSKLLALRVHAIELGERQYAEGKFKKIW